MSYFLNISDFFRIFGHEFFFSNCFINYCLALLLLFPKLNILNDLAMKNFCMKINIPV